MANVYEFFGGPGNLSSSDRDRLLAMFHDAGIDEDEIRRGIELDRSGYWEIAEEFGGISVNDARNMVHELIHSLRNDIEESYNSMVNEDDNDRYGYESDTLGNVTVRDAESGRSRFLKGSIASKLKAMLAAHPSGEQNIIAQFMGEALEESLFFEEDDDDYAGEVNSTRGTYNFPWTIAGKHGTATADYSGRGDPDAMTIVSVRDASGKEFDAEARVLAELKKQAIAFIGNA
jgi:hypothetical protein